MIRSQDVVSHYRHGALERELLEIIAAAQVESDRLAPRDLAGADEFHIGAAQATSDILAQLDLSPETRILDVGCGLGGPARHIVSEYGCRVTGIDLSDEYVDFATNFSERMGFADRLDFVSGDATRLPFPDASFDSALLLHVGMNIADKRALFAGIHRVLRSNGAFAVYDVMRVGAGPLVFPLPWSSTADTTALETPEVYCALLAESGFEVTAKRSRSGFARRFFAVAARQLEIVPAPLGIRLSQAILGGDLRSKIANMSALLDRGVIAPVEIISRRIG